MLFEQKNETLSGKIIRRALSILEGYNEVVPCYCTVSFFPWLSKNNLSNYVTTIIGSDFQYCICMVFLLSCLNHSSCYFLFPTRAASKRIISLIALSLDLDPEFFSNIGALDCPSAVLRLLHYPGYINVFPIYYLKQSEALL
jgi:hypothetical protein